MSGDEGYADPCGRADPCASRNVAGSGSETPDAPPQRLVTRVVSEFMVRVLTVAAKAHGGDYTLWLAFTAIQQANVEDLEPEPDQPWRRLGGYPPDELRRPITTHALSHSLSLAPETCRRYVNKLIEREYCQRVGDRGVIVPSAVMMREPFVTATKETHAAFLSMLREFRDVDFDVVGVATARYPKIGRGEPSASKLSEYALSKVIDGYLMRVILVGVGLHA